ncbi:hypothetical protein B0T24DRAFT_643367 [Lasiosphaeria ovina]|uniref:Uncharacterized protein n=1 Tax=Lasiosphaeria ovina TaxID=92902 RepID=A0AAE0MXX4_9PEZI|nr:hypothetical protein B0T24DRAFT_643367 [Lasiosphaeria ovina]
MGSPDSYAGVGADSFDSMKAELQQSFAKAFGRASHPYDRVGVLVLCWAEDDFTISCQTEAQRIIDVFQAEYRYEVHQFFIPVQNSRASQNALEQAVVGFKREYDVDGEANLMIVYYTGHADPDERRGKAVWAARSAGEPLVDWFEIQPTLFRCRSDVLLILDCCHASLAATKGRDEGRLEILAATDDAGRTPRPGPSSFTHFLVGILQQEARDAPRGGVRVVELQKRLNDVASRNPFYISMRSEAKSSILLRPLPLPLPDGDGDGDGDAPKGAEMAGPNPSASASASLTFTVSLGEPLTPGAVRELGDWLKNTAPKLITHVQVDRMVQLSMGMQQFVLGQDAAGLKGRLIDSCGGDDGNFFLSLLKGLALQIGEARTRMQMRMAATPPAAVDGDARGSADSDSARLAAETFSRLDSQVSRVFRALLGLVSGHSGFQDLAQLEPLVDSEAAGLAGLAKPARLSLMAIGPGTPPQPPYLAPGSVSFDGLCCDTDIYATGWHGGRRVIVELVPGNELESDLWKTQALLSLPIPERLRIAQCVGVVLEPVTHRPGPVPLPRFSILFFILFSDLFPILPPSFFFWFRTGNTLDAVTQVLARRGPLVRFRRLSHAIGLAAENCDDDARPHNAPGPGIDDPDRVVLLELGNGRVVRCSILPLRHVRLPVWLVALSALVDSLAVPVFSRGQGDRRTFVDLCVSSHLFSAFMFKRPVGERYGIGGKQRRPRI